MNKDIFHSFIDQNKKIAEFMDDSIPVTYHVGNKDTIFYSPPRNMFLPEDQKKECERFINKQLNNTIYKDCKVIKFEYPEKYHSNWNALMPVIAKLQEKKIKFYITPSITDMYELVLKSLNKINAKLERK